MTYHKPVLLNESIKGLEIKPNGIYVDVTFGGGGHSKEILKNLKGGFLYAFDQDSDAINNVVNASNFKLIRSNFRFIKNFLRLEGVSKIDGLIADLGISSYQIDVPERGFAHRFENQIDMRMNTDAEFDASDILNSYNEEDLSNVFYFYGEVNQSKKIAKRIIESRLKQKIETVNQFKNILQGIYPKKLENKFLSKIFQALRIEVNDEINSLKDLLADAIDLLNHKGRLVVISYHSLEDRLVKRFIRTGLFSGDPEKDFFGNIQVPLIKVGKLIVPTSQEINNNNRARSAKLRVAKIKK